MQAFHFLVDRIIFENNVVTVIHGQVSLKHKSKMTGDCCVFKYL